MLISACVATYRRPDGLLLLLESLSTQALRPGDRLEIVVVDNDPPSARTVIDAYRSHSPHELVYGEQPEANISLTRNRSVALANGELLWFIDDDEQAAPDCLEELRSAMERTNADVAFGHVVPEFVDEVPGWIQRAGIFNRPLPGHDKPSFADRTGNTLVRRTSLPLADPFDPRFGRTGGEDSDLFHRLRASGRLLVGAPAAVVKETVPPSRANWDWMVLRCKRIGELYGRKILRSSGGRRFAPPVLSMAVKAIVQVVGCAASSLVVWPAQRVRRELHQRMWVNVGKLSALRVNTAAAEMPFEA